MPTELACPLPIHSPTPAVVPTPVRVQNRWAVPAVLRGPFGALLAFVIAVLAAYAPALGGQFLWDDSFLVKGNLLIRSPLFCLEAFRHTLFNDESNFYRPAQTLTYILDYWCWDLEPYGYHLTNTLIHAGNALLLFLLLRRALAAVVPSPAVPVEARRRLTDRMAFGLALLWALHPVHSAAVAYISGRADSLAMGFCLAAWLACERALDSTRTAPRLGWASGAFACLLLGLCSKEIAFVWLVLFGFWLFALRPDPVPDAPRSGRRARLAVAGGGLVALGCYLCLRHLPPPPPPVPPFPVLPPKWLLMLRALGDYAGLLLFPHRLHMERQVFAAPGLGSPESPAFYLTLAVGGALLLVAFAAGVCLPGRGRLLRRCGAGWFLIGFLPVSNLFALNASVAEHWLYLPSIGFLLFLAGVALDLPWGRLAAARLPVGPVACALVILAAGSLGGRTWLRAHDWTDRLTFYQQTIRDGGDVPRAREGLALAYHDVGNEEAASAVLSKLTASYPHAMAARVNLATTSVRLGQNDKARAELVAIAENLLSTNDRHGGAREFTGTIRALDRVAVPGDPAWAVLRRRLLDESARFPHAWELAQIRIQDREDAHDLPGALALAAQFANGHWWHSPAQVVVGRLQAALGRTDEALATWRQAARLDVYDTDALSAAARVCLDQGRLPEAVALQADAVHRQPDSLRQHLLLAQALERAGRVEEAASERHTAAQLAQSENG